MTAIRRNIKNVVHNYSEAKVKVREATSNDPWGPPSSLMQEISDMTYNVMAYTEIMSLVWKRLNDKNKNWRHVYKALVLLDYLVKTGSEKVAQQCKENLFVIQSLRDFQYVEEAKDCGLNVREKAKQLVALLKDDEKLRSERASALRTRERLRGIGADGGGRPSSTGASIYRRASADFVASDRTYGGGGGGGGGGGLGRSAAGGGTGEAEDVELELALALSKEEHAEEVKRREAEGLKDDLKLKMALEASKKDEEERRRTSVSRQTSSGLVDLIDTNLSAAPANGPDPWGASASVWSDPWAPQPAAVNNGKAAAASVSSASDPWAVPSGGPSAHQHGVSFDDAFGSPADFSKSGASGAWSASSASAASNSASAESQQQQQQPPRAKSAHSFLGDHGSLVNLDSLVTQPKGNTNPFAPVSHGPSHPSNPFYATQPVQPTLSELQRRAATGGDVGFSVGGGGDGSYGLPPPLIQAPKQPQPLQLVPQAAYPAAYNPWGQQPLPQAQAQVRPPFSSPSNNPFM